MNVMRSRGQENLTYVLLTDAEVDRLRDALKPAKRSPVQVTRLLATELRRQLKDARVQR